MAAEQPSPARAPRADPGRPLPVSGEVTPALFLLLSAGEGGTSLFLLPSAGEGGTSLFLLPSAGEGGRRPDEGSGFWLRSNPHPPGPRERIPVDLSRSRER